METPQDLLSQKKVAFELGAKYPIENRYEALGGNSVNVAVGLKKLGENVAVYACVGDDLTGSWILEQLEKTGIEKNLVKIQQACQSDLSAIVVAENARDRIIFTNHMASKKMVFDGQKVEADFDWVFIGDLSGAWQKNLVEILTFAKEKKLKLAFNPRQKTIHEDTQKVLETIAQCDLLFLNKDEALEIIGASLYTAPDKQMKQEFYLAHCLAKIGAKTVVLTDGSRGAWAFANGKFFHTHAICSEKIVDTTGAGDAFTSGFFAAQLKEKSIIQSLHWGIANATSSLGQYGGQAGLLNQEQIENLN